MFKEVPEYSPTFTFTEAELREIEKKVDALPEGTPSSEVQAAYRQGVLSLGRYVGLQYIDLAAAALIVQLELLKMNYPEEAPRVFLEVYARLVKD